MEESKNEENFCNNYNDGGGGDSESKKYNISEMISTHQIILHHLNNVQDKDLIRDTLMNESREHNLLIGKHNKLTNEVLFLLKQRHQYKLASLQRSGPVTTIRSKYPPQKRLNLPQLPSFESQIQVPIRISLDIKEFRLREAFIISVEREEFKRKEEEEHYLFSIVAQTICEDFDIPPSLFIEPIVKGMTKDVNDYRNFISNLPVINESVLGFVSLDITCGFIRIQDSFQWKLFPIQSDEMDVIKRFSLSIVEENDLSLEFSTSIQHQICESLWKERLAYSSSLSLLTSTPLTLPQHQQQQNSLLITELDPLVLDEMESNGILSKKNNIRTPISYKGSFYRANHSDHQEEGVEEIINTDIGNGTINNGENNRSNNNSTSRSNRKKNRNRK